MVPERYHEFFVASAGVAGALIGLRFVAISVNPKAASSGPVRQRPRPAAALSAFLNPLFVSLVALLPEADLSGAFVALGSVGTLAVLGLLSFVVLEMRGEGVRPRLRTLLTLVLQLANSVAQLVVAFVLVGDPSTRGPVQVIAVTVIISFSVGIDRSWEFVGAQQASLLSTFVGAIAQARKDSDADAGVAVRGIRKWHVDHKPTRKARKRVGWWPRCHKPTLWMTRGSSLWSGQARRMRSSLALTAAQARGQGVTERVLRGPTYRRVFHGVYLPSGVAPTARRRAEAALAIAPTGTVLARHSAAALWGGVVPASPEVHLILPRGSRLRVNGVDARVRSEAEVMRHQGLPLTSPAQTFVDLATELSLLDLVVLGDSLVKAGCVTPGELVSGATAHRGRRARLARRAAAYVRVGVDSPMETRLRMLIILGGLPEPVVNHALRDETGRIRYRLDLAYPQWHVAIEYDGRQHAENTAQWRWDVNRREELDADGWRLVVVLSGDLYQTPSRTLDRVLAAARSQGVALRIRSEEWRRYFTPHD
jgi:hypothetical protein